VIDSPVGLGEFSEVVLHIVGTRARASILTENSSGPVATEGVVEDNLVVGKVGSRAVSSEGESSLRNGPGVGGGSVTVHISRDVIAWEKPDVDSSIAPFHRINTSFVVVKASSVRVSCRSSDSTARVIWLVGIADPAVRTGYFSVLLSCGVGHGASIRSV